MTPAENLFPNKGTCTGSREWTDSLGEGGTDQRVSVCCVLPQLFLGCPSSPGHCLSDWLASFLSHLWAPFPSTFLTLAQSNLKIISSKTKTALPPSHFPWLPEGPEEQSQSCPLPGPPRGARACLWRGSPTSPAGWSLSGSTFCRVSWVGAFPSLLPGNSIYWHMSDNLGSAPWEQT